MKINTQKINQNFGARLKTAQVLEVTSLKIFESDGISGCKNVIQTLAPIKQKGIGNKGYKYHAQIIGEKILEKYPKIKEATMQIKNILAENPNISKKALNDEIRPMINKIGQEIDIEI